jgi:hypothetical protein
MLGYVKGDGDMTKTTLAKANPNHHGWLKLVHHVDQEWEIDSYYVREPNSDGSADDVTDFDDDLAAAQAFYDQRLAFWMKEPNWVAQAAYDEAHGTENGYAPWQARGLEY